MFRSKTQNQENQMTELTIELPDRTYTIDPPTYPGAAFSRTYVGLRNKLLITAVKRAYELIPEAREAKSSDPIMTRWGKEFSRQMDQLSKGLFKRCGDVSPSARAQRV